MSTQSIHVSNLPTTADVETTLRDFFSFCGEILNFNLKDDGATIQFQSTDAAKSAVLLNGATLSGSVITVEPRLDESTGSASSLAPKTQSSVVEELVAAGYQLAEEASQKAKLYDEQYQVSNTAQRVVQRIDDLDKEYKISEKAQATFENIGQKIQDAEQEYQIGAGINQAIAAAVNTGELARDIVVARASETGQAIHEGTADFRAQTEAVTTSVFSSAAEAIDSLHIQEKGEAVVSSIQNFVETNDTAQSALSGLQTFANSLNDTVQQWVTGTTEQKEPCEDGK